MKNQIVGSDRTLVRKLKEAVVAIKLEKKYSKPEILEKYLNTVYFGHGAYGVQAASRLYFRRDAEDLTPLQSATLAGLIAAPSGRDPYLHPGEARRYRNVGTIAPRASEKTSPSPS